MKKGDLILIAVLLLAAGLLFLLFHSGKAGAVAVVAVDGEETGRYPLSVSGEFPLNGGTNILVIEDGTAYLREANCPDKLCVRQGKISLNGQRIVCLPNRLTVTIVGGEDAEIDIIVG